MVTYGLRDISVSGTGAVLSGAVVLSVLEKISQIKTQNLDGSDRVCDVVNSGADCTLEFAEHKNLGEILGGAVFAVDCKTIGRGQISLTGCTCTGFSSDYRTTEKAKKVTVYKLSLSAKAVDYGNDG